MAAQHDREVEELVAEWSSDLEAVLYQPEVEEAIREVSSSLTTASTPSSLSIRLFFVLPS